MELQRMVPCDHTLQVLEIFVPLFASALELKREKLPLAHYNVNKGKESKACMQAIHTKMDQQSLQL